MTRRSRTCFVVFVLFVGLTLAKPKDITVSMAKQAAAAHATNRTRPTPADLRELREDLERLRIKLVASLADDPENFDAREELWMRHENKRGLLAALERIGT